MIETVHTVPDLRAACALWRQKGQSIALVPTMGALHEGHMDLVRAARHRADKVVASIFVNPGQFAAHEDLGQYPRTLEQDGALLLANGCDLLYAPTEVTMYRDSFQTSISLSHITAPLEGIFRPHFFGGVATVVLKLFLQVMPNVAFFGEKDWQQLQTVRQMAIDLDLDIAIIGIETRREADGLAMSSRNAYLMPEQRAIAPALKLALDQIYEDVASGTRAPDISADAAKAALLARGFTSIDYLAPCHAETLASWQTGDPLRILGAAWLGTTRLIDNRGA
jgi:pantoate--beta-alanine ligase